MPSFAPRLVSLLSSIESALSMNECEAVRKPPQRFINFQKGLARMTFADGSGSITLQNFTLADGQICVRATYAWRDSSAMESCAIYPNKDNFDWFGAAATIGEGWMNGPPPAPATPAPGAGTEPFPAAS